MSPSSFLRLATRARPAVCRVARPAAVTRFAPRTFATSTPFRAAAAHEGDHDPHHEESFEDFSARYENEFNSVQDVFELQRNLNNAFAYDLVPSVGVVTAALRAARRVNDYPTAVRVFEGIKAKVENKTQYEEYLRELEPIRSELGVSLKEVMYPESS